MKCCCLVGISLLIFTSCNKDDEFEKVALQESDIEHSLQRSCGMQEHMRTLLSDPNYEKQRNERLAEFELVAASASTRTLCGDPVLLPVAVHYQGATNPNTACLRALAQTQVDILNNDYHGTNSDITTWINDASPQFPGVNYGETCVEFCIATQNHPSGYGLNDGDPAVTINATTGDFDANWSGYLNIFVQPNTGVLGYSPLGGSGNGDGVVIDASAFGAGSGCGNVNPQSPYNLGRTLTHELGHYLLLDHIWGGGCGSDDDVGDTPNSQNPYYGCPSIGASSCSSTDMHMNYMDYVNDLCMYMFSDGQSNRMENYVTSSLQNLVTNASNVCGSGGGGPTCTDGVQNGDETGIDCGGSCPPCDGGATCTDGIQNGDETGVDCGGSCPPCDGDGPDLALFKLLRPSAEMCNTRFRPLVRVKNTGTEAITSFTIKYGVVGGVTKQKTFNVSVAPNQVKRLGLPAITVGDGSMVFYAKTLNPNGQTDSNPSNDEKQRSITVNGNQLVNIYIQPDDYASEITWEITDNSNSVVASGGPWQDGNTNRRIKNVCLTEGCYTFTIYDSYGDGICCDYGNGFYRIKDYEGNIIAESDGQYGFSEEQTICVTYDSYTYEGARRQEKIGTTLTESLNFIDIEGTRSGSEIIVKDSDGILLDKIIIDEANKTKRIDKSKYQNKDIQVEFSDKKGKIKSMK